MSHGGGMTINLNNQGSSKLWEKNKMLATLLAKEPVHITQVGFDEVDLFLNIKLMTLPLPTICVL